MAAAFRKRKFVLLVSLHIGEHSRLNVVFKCTPDIHSRESVKSIHRTQTLSWFKMPKLKKWY